MKPATSYELPAYYDARKSFYGKAVVYVDDKGNRVLRSYDTDVATWNIDDTLYILEGAEIWWSATTSRHISEFVRQHGGNAMGKKDILWCSDNALEVFEYQNS